MSALRELSPALAHVAVERDVTLHTADFVGIQWRHGFEITAKAWRGSLAPVWLDQVGARFLRTQFFNAERGCLVAVGEEEATSLLADLQRRYNTWLQERR